MGTLRVRGLTKGYGGPPVVEDFDLAVGRGEAVALIGPNGAGKTTVLRAIAGRIVAEKGRISVDGMESGPDGSDIEFRRRLLYVPDNPVLFDDLTLEEHMEFTAAAFGLGDASAEADELLGRFRLADRRHDLPTTFSRGMRQRAQLCCAFLRPSSVILVDEPFVGLDPQGSRTLLDLIDERKADGTCLVVATHVLTAAERFCDRVLLLTEGETLFDGTMAELRADSDAHTLDDLFVEMTEQEDQ